MLWMPKMLLVRWSKKFCLFPEKSKSNLWYRDNSALVSIDEWASIKIFKTTWKICFFLLLKKQLSRKSIDLKKHWLNVMEHDLEIRKLVMPNGDTYISIDDLLKYIESLPSHWGNRMSAAEKQWIKDVLNHSLVKDIQWSEIDRRSGMDCRRNIDRQRR